MGEVKPRDVIQFETTFGRVKCQDGDHVWFPRYFGENIAGQINGRKCFVTLTFDAPLDYDKLKSQLAEVRRERDGLKSELADCTRTKNSLHLSRNQYRTKLAKLETWKAKAVEVIRYYASEDTWIQKEFDKDGNLSRWQKKTPNDVSIFPYSIGRSKGNFNCLGRKARAFLEREGK